MEYSLLRQRARENLKNNWALSIAVAAIAYFSGALLTGSGFLPTVEIKASDVRELNDLWDAANYMMTAFLSFAGMLGLAQFILGGVIQLGYVKFLLKQHDGIELDWKDLFSEFDRFGVGFLQAFLRGLYTALWSLLFIIPGIVKSFSYAMTPYILAENPDMTASEAIDRSRSMMDGHKGELFVLRLTFIGWNILAGLTLNLGYLLLNPYTNAAETAFYRQLQVQQKYAAIERYTTIE